MKTLPLFCLATLLASPAQAQVRLSELLASNTRAFPDIVDFDDYPDWIELQNPTGSAVNLANHYLSDDPANPYKWPFPATASIPANGFLLVMADGHDAIPGQTFPRGYWPWRDFTTERYHTNFALASEGETLLLTRVDTTTPTPLVNSAFPTPANAAVWKFKDDGSNQSTQWRTTTFDDSTWASGPSELGYSDAPQTTVSFGGNTNNKHITTYFRHTFNIVSPSAYQGLTFQLLVDDGAVIYLNGTEIIRRNLPLGEITHQTLALSAVGGTAETTFTPYNVPSSLLVPGSNVIAVEVHQSDVTSSDLSFDLAVTANTITATQLDSVSYTQQVSDVSYGRDPATPSNWVQFAESSPGAANTAAVVDDVRIPGKSVSASLAGGVHTGPQTVTLTAPAGAIHYTLNGGDPTSSSPIYTIPIEITATTVLRARCFETGKAPGQILTRTYFINETQGTLPYISVVADPKTLFDDTIGIYYNQHEQLVSSGTFSPLGYRDVYKGKDAPGHIEFFAPGGSSSFRANVGIRIGGENNWVHPQKALNLAVRGKYGDDEIKYNIFPDEGTPIYKALTLRDGGDRWASEMLRDCMWPKLAHGFLKVDVADYRPSVVFINGQYFGLHDMRERWDDTWFTQRYQVPEGKVDHLLYGHNTSSSVTLGVEKGDSVNWLEFMNFINIADLTNPANWAFVESRIDLDSFMDFVISESYGNNTSWFHNREFWKERKAGAKWQWFLTDMDRTLSTSKTTGILAEMLASDDVLMRLKLNTGFKQRLAQRYAAHMAATFTEARVQGLMTQLGNEISATEVARHEARWWTGNASTSGMTAASRAAGISGTLTYATTRAGNVHSEIVAQLGVSTAVNLTLATTGSGTVRVQGVPVEPSTFKMFPNIPITLEAIPAPGYAFSSWTGATGSESTSLTLAGAETVTANFVPSTETLIGGTLPADTTLSLGSSPYVLTDDLIVPPGITLTIPAGVTIHMTSRRNIRVQGTLIVNGTAGQPVHLIGRSGARWGGVSFESPATPSTLAHLVIRDASKGFDPVTYPSAISGLNANLTLDFIDIRESQGPVFCRGGSVTLRDSTLQNPYTGDCINVKQGLATTQRCTFLGNNQPDTDAIDYDGVPNGLIEDCRIYRFQGSNSDGIDVGEACSNVLIQGNLIYYNSDKGFSVGQASTVTLRKNLVVGCTLGVGIKDTNSVATIDQNTFVNCGTGVAVYEKNFGDGGGSAVITNTIISKSTTPPVTVDSFSTASVSYSLSDTIAIAGSNNLLADPRFVEPVLLNFQLQPTSPAINSGDPGHALDPDLTRVDRGAAYLYQALDYPFTIGETVVINEILANSGTEPDWIELHNRTLGPVDISGWFLSDDGTNPAKYRIPAGTILPAGGYATFYEDVNFGTNSIDPNKVTPFALSDIGETVYISSAANDELTDYQSKENFGASAEGESLGYYYKPSTDSYNFVAMAQPTPSAPNSNPRVGPVVISEIMYNPPGSSDLEEYIELHNISDAPVILYDAIKQKPWTITDGFDYIFPTNPPLTMAAGERIILTRNITSFQNTYGTSDTRKFQWSAGVIDNGGETLQIAKPGGVDGLNVTQYIRIDRVAYDDEFPWPTSPDGSGTALTKVAIREYGNDFTNWIATTANPGAPNPGSTFTDWIGGSGLPLDQRDPATDFDGDGRSNLLEYALGSSASAFNSTPPFLMSLENGRAILNYSFRTDLPGTVVRIEQSSSLADGSWTPVNSAALGVSAGLQQRGAEIPMSGRPQTFFRMVVIDPEP